MPLHLQFGADDLLRIRFAVSPLCETHEAVRTLRRADRHGYHTPWLRRMFHLSAFGVLVIQFVVAIYGGYFGGAMGIIMLAVYSLFGLTNLNAMNAMKALLAGVINAISVVLFAAAGKVAWTETVVALVTAVLGGYLGARVARKMKPAHLRLGIVAISVTVTIVFFARQYG